MSECTHDSWRYVENTRICANPECEQELPLLMDSVLTGQEKRCQCGHKRKHHQGPDCLKCLDKGELSFLHSFTEVQIPDPLAPRPLPGTPLAVVYETAGGHFREMLVPPGAAITHHSGGILVQHEDGEVVRIRSVRQLIPGEAHAAEDHE